MIPLAHAAPRDAACAEPRLPLVRRVSSLFLSIFLPLAAATLGPLDVCAQSCAPVPPNAVAWWRAENDASDPVGSHHGTLQNGAAFAPGKVGTAFSFDGVDEQVEIADVPGLNPTTAVTLEAWVNPQSLDRAYNAVVAKSGAGGRSYGLWITSGGKVHVEGTGVGSSYAVTATGLVAPGVWTHVAAVITAGSGFEIYVNGALRTQTGSGSPALSASTSPVTIGNSDAASGDYWFAGLIDEVAVFDRALTAAEIQAIYDAGSAGKCASVCQPPTVTQPPSPQAACTGSPVTFTVQAAGTAPLAYQWLKDGNDIPGETASTLTIASVSPSAAGQYSVRVSNDCGQQTSAAAQLTVDASILLSQAKPVTGSGYYDGGSDVFPYDNLTDGRYNDTGTGFDWSFWLTPNWQGGWAQVDLGAVYQVDAIRVQNTRNRGYNDRGTQSFSIETSTDGVSYTPVVTGTLASVWGLDPIPFESFSFPAQPARFVRFNVLTFYGASGGLNELEVYGLGCNTPPCIAPGVLASPQPQAVCPTSPASFTVQASGTEPLTYQWRKDGNDLSGETADTLTIPSVSPSHAGLYSVRVSNACGDVESLGAQLSIADAPPTVLLNGSASVVVEACTGTYTEPGATASDDCDGVLSVLIGGDTVDPSTVGTYHVAYSATDSSGQTTTLTRTVTVQDTTPPVFTAVPGSLTLACGPASQTDIAAWLASAAATDDCGSPSLQPAIGPFNGPCNTGTATVIWTATDTHGLAATATATLTITPDTALTGVAIEPSELQFALTPNTGVHTTTVTLRNDGACPSVIQSAPVAMDPNAPALTVVSPALPATICPSDELVLTLHADTTGALAGDFSGNLTLQAPDGSARVLPVGAPVGGSAGPDLTFHFSNGGLSVTPDSSPVFPGAGEGFTVTARIKNVGNQATTGATVSFFAESASLGDVAIGGLAPGATTTAELPISAGLARGWYLIKAQIARVASLDPELKSENNVASTLLQVGMPFGSAALVEITGAVTPNCDSTAAVLDLRARYVFSAGATLLYYPMQGASLTAVLDGALLVSGGHTDNEGRFRTHVALPQGFSGTEVTVTATDFSVLGIENLPLQIPNCNYGGSSGSSGSASPSYPSESLDLYVCSGDITFRGSDAVTPLSLPAPQHSTLFIHTTIHYYTSAGSAMSDVPVHLALRKQNSTTGEFETYLETTEYANFSGGGSAEVSTHVPSLYPGTYSLLVSLEPTVSQPTANDQATRALTVETPDPSTLAVTAEAGGCGGPTQWVSGRATYYGTGGSGAPFVPVICGEVTVEARDNSGTLLGTAGGFRTDRSGAFYFNPRLTLPPGANTVTVTVFDGTLSGTSDPITIECSGGYNTPAPDTSPAAQGDLYLFAEDIAFLGNDCSSSLRIFPGPSDSFSIAANVHFWDASDNLNLDPLDVAVRVLTPTASGWHVTTLAVPQVDFDAGGAQVVCVSQDQDQNPIGLPAGPHIVQVEINPDGDSLPFADAAGNNAATKLIQIGQSALSIWTEHSYTVYAGGPVQEVAFSVFATDQQQHSGEVLLWTANLDPLPFGLEWSCSGFQHQGDGTQAFTGTLAASAATPPGWYVLYLVASDTLQSLGAITTFQLTVLPPINTLVGEPSIVDPSPSVHVTFDKVTTAGTTTATAVSPPPALPSGFQFGTPPVVWDLSTTAFFEGEIDVCFDYDESAVGDEALLQLWHYEGGQWVDVTIPGGLDTDNNRICGRVSSLSPFALVEPVGPPPPVAPPQAFVRGPGLTLKIGIADLLASCSDPGGNPLALHSVGPSGQGGTVVLGATHVLYTPANDNPDTFSYTIANALGTTATGHITVTVVNPGGSVQNIDTSGGGVTLQFAGIPGYTYRVQRTVDFAVWQDLDTHVIPARGLFSFTDPAPPQPFAAYRLIQN